MPAIQISLPYNINKVIEDNKDEVGLSLEGYSKVDLIVDILIEYAKEPGSINQKIVERYRGK